MALVARPLAALGFDPVGAATLAGVIVSLIAALFAMIAIADLARGDSEPDEDAGGNALRAAFYLAIWPAAVFLAQVYSREPLPGVLVRRAGAPEARSLGMGRAAGGGAPCSRGRPACCWSSRSALPGCLAGERRTLPRAALAAAPLIAYLAWRLVFGADFDFVETRYFGRWPLAIGRSVDAWSDFAQTLSAGDPQARAYDLVEMAGIVASLVTAALLWRRDKALTLYGLATFAVVATSGAALGMHRYALAMPSLFMAPAYLAARHPVFDRAWTLACCLGLAALTLAFSFGFWAG